MECNDLISVIVPVYNVCAYLEECVNSIMRQTYYKIEIILIDDGSIDGSGEICDTLALLDSRIKVYHKENGGVSSARNMGLMKATGQYIGFVDADDVIDAQMYEVLYQNIKKFDADFSYCLMKRMYGEQIDNKEGENAIFLPGEEGYSLRAYFGLTPRPHIGKSVCNKLFSRSILHDFRFEEKYILGEDNLFMTKTMINLPRCVYIGKVLYFYRDQREGNSKKYGIISEKTFTSQIPVKQRQIQMLSDAGYEDIYKHEKVIFYKELLRYHKLISKIKDSRKQHKFYGLLNDVIQNEKNDIKKSFYYQGTTWKYRIKYFCWFHCEWLLCHFDKKVG